MRLPWPTPDPVAPGQESVWDYPRPAVWRQSARHVRIEHRGVLVAETRNAIEVIETSHPPSYYIPVGDVRAVLRPAPGRSLCEWKGSARYFDVIAGSARMAAAAWCYADPTPAFAVLAGHLAFYAAPFERCSVDGEVVRPQPGGFYGGWVTGLVAGPFKGVPGSEYW
jgi:uncharacterized protein (DUF427 family)